MSNDSHPTMKDRLTETARDRVTTALGDATRIPSDYDQYDGYEYHDDAGFATYHGEVVAAEPFTVRADADGEDDIMVADDYSSTVSEGDEVLLARDVNGTGWNIVVNDGVPVVPELGEDPIYTPYIDEDETPGGVEGDADVPDIGDRAIGGGETYIVRGLVHFADEDRVQRVLDVEFRENGWVEVSQGGDIRHAYPPGRIEEVEYEVEPAPAEGNSEVPR